MTWLAPLDRHLRDAYLRRLGLAEVPPPTLDALFALHRAQLERIPYESVWIWLGERRTIEPLDSVRLLLAGRGGYCYHLNGALATLLGWLGFDVRWHVAGVQAVPEEEAGANGNHLALTVAGLPSPANEAGTWLCDAGLGHGPHEPVPLVPGIHRQGPFSFGIAPSAAVEGGWRFQTDPRMSALGMDFEPGPAQVADFTARHEFLQSDPRSGFVRVVTAFRRDREGLDGLRGRVLRRVTGTGETATELTTSADWFAALADVFDLPLADVDDERRADLWRRVDAAHEDWLAGSVQ
jgi:N-hydroxyarylamine O-acetyltransferase